MTSEEEIRRRIRQIRLEALTQAGENKTENSELFNLGIASKASPCNHWFSKQ
ncbi:hypothetical protein LJB89_01035 [Tyzzerella sp. OttesenSCG-928-J15]|nr:hypothetical protein [Tyzzerella sp. OttesenSCG-928-J15]